LRGALARASPDVLLWRGVRMDLKAFGDSHNPATDPRANEDRGEDTKKPFPLSGQRLKGKFYASRAHASSGTETQETGNGQRGKADRFLQAGSCNEKTPGVEENLRLVLDLGNFDQSRRAIDVPLRQLEHHRVEHEPARRASQGRSK
jgi:hypothetical protein